MRPTWLPVWAAVVTFPMTSDITCHKLRAHCIVCCYVACMCTYMYSVYSSLVQNMHRALHAHAICTYVHMYICTYVHMYICTYVHMYICTYVHIRTDFHTVSIVSTLADKLWKSLQIVTDLIGLGMHMRRRDATLSKRRAFYDMMTLTSAHSVERSMESALLSFNLPSYS